MPHFAAVMSVEVARLPCFRTAVRIRPLRLSLALALGAAAPLLACGGDAPPPANVPAAAPRVVEMPACPVTAAKPWIVDMRPEERIELELAMRAGFAVVSYDCRSIRVLRGCQAKSRHTFVGASAREFRVKLTSREEVVATLPARGAVIARELSPGGSVDIDVAVVGEARARSLPVARPGLSGECAGATHLVRAAEIGGFRLALAGATPKELSQGGDAAACRAGAADAAAPPAACHEILRVELEPIAESPPAECAVADEGACKDACDRGNAKSCVKVADMLSGRKPGQKSVPAESVRLASLACEADLAEGCELAGEVLAVDKSPAARAPLERACELGRGAACERLGAAPAGDVLAPASAADAQRLLGKACALGVSSACATAGERLAAAGALDAADKSFDAACKSTGPGAARACLGWGNVYFAETPHKDLGKALQAYARACAVGSGGGCHAAGAMHAAGLGTKKDLAAAVELYEKGCASDKGPKDACVALGELYETGRQVKKDVAKAAELYEKGCERGGCLRLGRLHEAGALGDKKKDPDSALRAYRRECDAIPGWEACQAQGRLLEAREANQARAFYAARCTSAVAITWACEGLKRTTGATALTADIKPAPPPAPSCVTPLACPPPAAPAAPKPAPKPAPKK